MKTRREILTLMGLAPLALSQQAWPQSQSANYMKPLPHGRAFSSLAEARRARPGDVVLMRDMTKLAPADIYSTEFVRGKWRLQPYELADGQSGKLLMVNDWAKFDAPKAVPPQFEVKVDL